MHSTLGIAHPRLEGDTAFNSLERACKDHASSKIVRVPNLVLLHIKKKTSKSFHQLHRLAPVSNRKERHDTDQGATNDKISPARVSLMKLSELVQATVLYPLRFIVPVYSYFSREPRPSGGCICQVEAAASTIALLCAIVLACRLMMSPRVWNAFRTVQGERTRTVQKALHVHQTN